MIHSKDLEARYHVARSRIFARINGLKQLGYSIAPEKQDNQNMYNADQIAVMNQLDAHLKSGEPIAIFSYVTFSGFQV